MNQAGRSLPHERFTSARAVRKLRIGGAVWLHLVWVHHLTVGLTVLQISILSVFRPPIIRSSLVPFNSVFQGWPDIFLIVIKYPSSRLTKPIYFSYFCARSRGDISALNRPGRCDKWRSVSYCPIYRYVWRRVWSWNRSINSSNPACVCPERGGKLLKRSDKWTSYL